jgi:hypothetical protein
MIEHGSTISNKTSTARQSDLTLTYINSRHNGSILNLPFHLAYCFLEMLSLAILALCLPATVFGLNFDWERDQLTESEALANPAIRFGSLNATPIDGCRTIPGDSAWPSEATWAALNATLGGVLLRPRPLGSVCYFGPSYDAQRCSFLQQSWTNGSLQYPPLPFPPLPPKL